MDQHQTIVHIMNKQWQYAWPQNKEAKYLVAKIFLILFTRWCYFDLVGLLFASVYCVTMCQNIGKQLHGVILLDRIDEMKKWLRFISFISQLQLKFERKKNDEKLFELIDVIV